jgi:hypothetical protein
MRRFVLALPLVLVGSFAAAEDAPSAASTQDVVVMKDGRRLEGEVVAEDDRFVSLKSGGVTRAYAKDQVASVEKASRPTAPDGGTGATPATPAAPESAKGKKNKGDRRDVPLSDAAKKWLDDLILRAADADETVRRSIGAAVQALGPQAVPTLRAARDAAPEGPQKQFLDRLANEIEQRRDRRLRGEGDGPDGPMGPGGRPGMGRGAVEDMMQKLSTELELTDDEKPKVESIVADVLRRRFEIFRDARREGLSQEQIAEKAAALRGDTLTRMKEVLTAPQYAEFEEMANRFFETPRGPGMQPEPPKPADPAK